MGLPCGIKSPCLLLTLLLPVLANVQYGPLPAWREDDKTQQFHVKVLPLSFEGPEGEPEEPVDEVGRTEGG